MILLQLSSNTGPEECCLAVSKALDYLTQEAAQSGVALDVLEQRVSERLGNFRSVLVALDGNAALALAQRWRGSIQWICESPYRPRHRRKNWFIGAEIFASDARTSPDVDLALDNAIRYEAMRASGPGGQHVNKTDSAIRATHIPSGISVKVQTQRSQHVNKRLARALLKSKLDCLAQDALKQSQADRRIQHHQGQRGNAARVFHGQNFQLVT